MKVVLYGASGMIGSRVLNELVLRCHAVTAIVRNPAKIAISGPLVCRGDILDVTSVAESVKGSEAVISAYAPPFSAPEKLVEATRIMLSVLGRLGIRRFLMVGGAGSLEVAPGVQLLDTCEIPPVRRPYALAHREALALLRNSDLDWTNLSPAALIQPGGRSGKFRLGQDSLVADENGESRISAEDFALALVDELERPRHIRRRFTVGY